MLRTILLLLALLAILSPAVEGTVTAQTEITLPTYQGTISVAPGGRYFVDEAGQGFLVIGQNDGTPWPGLSDLLMGGSPSEAEAYIMDLRAHGITVSRIMIEYSQQPHSYLENPVGTFNPDVVAFWDQFIPLAEKHGLYLLLTPYDTFWQAENWGAYPYNGEQGGPCPTRSDWLTNPACIEAQKNRWRFIIDRWGGSPNIFAWDLMNEIDIWWNAAPTEIQAYVDDMAAFVREYETEKWGRAHMISVSSAEGVPTGRLGRVIFQHPALDFANTHLYVGPDIKDPPNPIGAGPTIAGSVILALDSIQNNRPYFDSETGPIDKWITDVDFDKEYHHNISWAHLIAGGAGSGMRWPYTNPHWILPELRDNLLGLARYAATVDWAHFVSRNINPQIKLDTRGIISTGCSDGRTALVWLLIDGRQRETGTLAGVEITIDGVLADGRYVVEVWETYEGNILDMGGATASDGVLSVTVPDLGVPLKDVALIIRPMA